MSVFSGPALLHADLHSAAVLGLDAGGSGTKWYLARDGQVVATGRAAPLTAALLPTPAGAAALREVQDALPERPGAVWVGLPGLGAAATPTVSGALAQAFGIGAARVRAENDLELAYAAHLAPGAGVLLYAGTGSIAYHVRPDGSAARAGGRGYRIGDDGAAASLGREALRWLTDVLDQGAVPAGPLADALAEVTGGLDWDTLRAYVYGTPGAAALARLAPAVSRAAEQGDGTALVLLHQAAAALAGLAGRLRQQVGPLPVVATGGTLSSPRLQDALRAALPGVRIQFRDHAAVAAQRAAGLLEHLT